MASTLEPRIHEGPMEAALNEAFREDALRELRRTNFQIILDRLDRIRKPGQRKVLDVGCGHGWFVEAAVRRGYDVTGLEPDSAIAAKARGQPARVITGFFPNDLPPGERFDIISFHDVFEHLPDPRAAAVAAHRLLTPRGILVLNLPSSRGALFRAARLLARVGMPGALDRMWQRGFPSPHLSYFHPGMLSAFVSAIGFQEVYTGTLTSVTRSGLWPRLRADRGLPLWRCAVLWMVLVLSEPAIQRLPADISLQVFQRIDP